MNRRKLFILIMALLTCIYYGMYVYRFFFKPTIGVAINVMYTFQEGYFAFAWIGDKVPMEPTYASQAGIRVGDKIVAVYDFRGKGTLIKSRDDLYEMIDRRIRLNESWTLVVLREFKDRPPINITLEMPPLTYATYLSQINKMEMGVYFILPIFIIITAFFIGITKYKNDNAFLAFLLLLSVAITFGINYSVFPPGLRETGAVYFIALRVFLSYLFMRFFMLFPSPSIIETRFPWIKKVFLIATILYAIYALVAYFIINRSFELYHSLQHKFPYGTAILDWMQLTMLAIGIISLVSNIYQLKGKDEQRRMIILLCGTLITSIPLISLLGYIRIYREIPSQFTYIFVGICMAIFPASFAYVILKHRVFGIRVILRRSLQYMLISRGFLLGEGLLIFLMLFYVAGPVFMKLLPGISIASFGVTSAVLTLVVLTAMRALNRRVIPAIDRRFFRDAVKVQEILKELSNTIRGMAAHPKELLRLVADTLCNTLYPAHVGIFLLPHKSTSQTIHATGQQSQPTGSPRLLYHCEALRFRQEAHKGIIDCFQDYTDASIIDDGYITERLEEAMQVSPRALDVYPDDPESWTRRLTAKGITISNWKNEIIFQLDSLLLVPLTLKDRIMGFISLGEKLSEEPYTHEDKELLTAVSDQIALALNYAELIYETTEQEKLKYEFELAREVQAKLFPQVLPKLHTLEFTGICRTARQVSGDYYDFLQLPEQKLGIVLADISGKGISAALLMANLQAFLRSNAVLRGDNVVGLINDLNHCLCATTDTNRYSSLFYAVYDDTSSVLTYVNAGHNPPLLFRTATVSGKRKRTVHYEVTSLESTGTIIGAFPDAAYQQETITLQPSDLLILFSDSVPASLNGDGEEFGEERLIALATAYAHLPIAEFQELIIHEIEQFIGYSPPHDDLTFIIIKVLETHNTAGMLS